MTENYIVGILYFIAMTLACISLVFYVYSLDKTKQEQRKYIETLNDHDKAIICEYLNKGRIIKKRSKQK